MGKKDSRAEEALVENNNLEDGMDADTRLVLKDHANDNDRISCPVKMGRCPNNENNKERPQSIKKLP